MLFQFTQYYGGGAGNFQTALYWLNNWGLQDLWIPFILIFGLLFGILQKIAIFHSATKKIKTKNEKGEMVEIPAPDKKINGILAFTISLILAAGHVMRYYPPNVDPFNIIIQFIPQTGVALVAILLAILILGFVADKPTTNNSMITVFVIIAIAAVLVSILGAIYPAFMPDWLRFNPLLQAVVIVIAIMGLVIWYITKDDDTGSGGGMANLKKLLTNE